MATVIKFGPMAQNTKVNGKLTKLMVLAS